MGRYIKISRMWGRVASAPAWSHGSGAQSSRLRCCCRKWSTWS